MKEIKVHSTTQYIKVDPSTPAVSIINAGPLGPPGTVGPQGPQGPIGPSGIHVGTIPPEDTSILWYDTN